LPRRQRCRRDSVAGAARVLVGRLTRVYFDNIGTRRYGGGRYGRGGWRV